MRAYLAGLGRFVGQVCHFGFSTRRALFPLVVLVGLSLVALVAAVKVVVPVVVYPLL